MFDIPKDLKEKLEKDPAFMDFSRRARVLEEKIMETLEREGCQDLRLVAAAIGPLFARAMAHLGLLAIKGQDPEQLIREAFTRLCDIAVDHYRECEHIHGPKKEPDIYAPPSPHMH